LPKLSAEQQEPGQLELPLTQKGSFLDAFDGAAVETAADLCVAELDARVEEVRA
jgi:hypothetical protein